MRGRVSLKNFVLYPKPVMKMKRTVIIAALCFLGLSCETEETVINNIPQNNLVDNIALTGKLRRMVQSPAAIDDMIDGSSCFAIDFPFTVTVNSQQVNLNSAADYQQVRDILNASYGDEDVVAIQFPVTVTYADYTKAVISGQSQLNQAIAGCNASVELSCMNLTYPLEVKSYNSQNQLAQTFSLGNKKAVFDFLKNITGYDAVALNYPIIFTAPDGSTQSINSNQALETAIDSFTDECLEALDPQPQPGTVFQDVIVQGTWYVAYFFDNGEYTNNYSGYTFTFSSNGTVAVSGTATIITGTWLVTTDDGEDDVEFTFSGSQLDDLEEDWTIINVTENLIELQKGNTGSGGVRYLTFSKY